MKFGGILPVPSYEKIAVGKDSFLSEDTIAETNTFFVLDVVFKAQSRLRWQTKMVYPDFTNHPRTKRQRSFQWIILFLYALYSHENFSWIIYVLELYARTFI